MSARHSVAAQVTIDTSVPGMPFDSTPGTFDTQFFVETQLRGKLWPGTVGNHGEVESPFAGELRLQSDFELARDWRTACEWQSYVSECSRPLRILTARADETADDQEGMRADFNAAMAKLAVVGQDTSAMVDCSEVIPEPQWYDTPAYFPNGTTYGDVQQACATTPFPPLATEPGSATSTE